VIESLQTHDTSAGPAARHTTSSVKRVSAMARSVGALHGPYAGLDAAIR
jgi:hypothetical protein